MGGWEGGRHTWAQAVIRFLPPILTPTSQEGSPCTEGQSQETMSLDPMEGQNPHVGRKRGLHTRPQGSRHSWGQDEPWVPLLHVSVFICKVGLLQGFNEIQPGIGYPIPWTIPVPHAPSKEGCERKESCPQGPARAGGPKERWEGHLEEAGPALGGPS